jgi:hypothetical protein
MFLLLLLAIDERQRPCKPGMPTCLSVRYDENLGFGGDEVELLRRVRRRGRIVWLADNAVITSSPPDGPRPAAYAAGLLRLPLRAAAAGEPAGRAAGDRPPTRDSKPAY